MSLKRNKMKEMVLLLDLFDGKISLSELLDTDISLLNQLRDAKLEILDERDREESGKKKTELANTMLFNKEMKDTNND